MSCTTCCGGQGQHAIGTKPDKLLISSVALSPIFLRWCEPVK
jgi:hypothetical protein